MDKQPTSKLVKPAKKARRLKHWLKESLFVIILFIAFSAVLDYWRSQEMPDGNMAPFITQTTQAEQLDLIALSHDKPVLVYFWATWCTACKFVTPTVDWMSNHFETVTVALSSGDNRRLNAFAQNHDYSFRIINDNRNNLGREWGITATPSVVILKEGKIISATTGLSTPPGLWLRMLLSQ